MTADLNALADRLETATLDPYTSVESIVRENRTEIISSLRLAASQQSPAFGTEQTREALEDIAGEIRQALVDAAYATKGLKVSASSAMFKAEKLMTAVISKFQDALHHPSSPAPGLDLEAFTAEDAWDDLINKDDRTSPEEYPDMVLISQGELSDYIERAILAPQPAPKGDAPMPRGGIDLDWHAESIKLYRQNKALRKALQEHHDWHLAQDEKDFGDGIALNMADEYGDGSMYERTTAALSEVLPSGIAGYEAWKEKSAAPPQHSDVREALEAALPIVKMMALTNDDPEYAKAERLVVVAMAATTETDGGKR